MALAYTKNVVHAGGVDINPTLNREGQAASQILPGAVISFGDNGASVISEPTNGAILYVADKAYLKAKGVNDLIPAGELVVGIHPLPGMFLNLRALAGTYKAGDPVTIGANGQITGSSTNVFAYVEEDEQITVKDGGLVRVVFK